MHTLLLLWRVYKSTSFHHLLEVAHVSLHRERVLHIMKSENRRASNPIEI